MTCPGTGFVGGSSIRCGYLHTPLPDSPPLQLAPHRQAQWCRATTDSVQGGDYCAVSKINEIASILYVKDKSMIDNK